ncbi:helix-turn-helix domain-containing protein [Massilia rubra]|uniref:Helix-turn-helix domain-containing protein n=1 Tax=Massilia rubra TaxID=2607910 RepID=A0ABX0LSC3_9BURK|nr:helix-turn-helix domain-containing protein [Massilia rubra]NHZ33036.1 helix-turn-helix domain-containing protein [Massilia rubra]
MAKTISPLLPTTDALLRDFGERLRLARLRRKLTAKQVAQRAGMAPMTLRAVERGGAGVTIGAYLAVMQILGLESDFALLAKADETGRDLQDARLHARVRRSVDQLLHDASGKRMKKVPEPSPRKQMRNAVPQAAAPLPDVPALAPGDNWIEEGGFSSAEVLAELIMPDTQVVKKGR